MQFGQNMCGIFRFYQVQDRVQTCDGQEITFRDRLNQHLDSRWEDKNSLADYVIQDGGNSQQMTMPWNL